MIKFKQYLNEEYPINDQFHLAIMSADYNKIKKMVDLGFDFRYDDDKPLFLVAREMSRWMPNYIKTNGEKSAGITDQYIKILELLIDKGSDIRNIGEVEFNIIKHHPKIIELVYKRFQQYIKNVKGLNPDLDNKYSHVGLGDKFGMFKEE
jgi:hypothetical protein